MSEYGDFKVFRSGDEWVIACDAVDAQNVCFEATGESPANGSAREWEECPPDRLFTLHDDGAPSQTQTYAAWARRGRGHLACG